MIDEIKNPYLSTVFILVLLNAQWISTAGAERVTNTTSYVESYVLLRQKILNSPLVREKIPLYVTGPRFINMMFLPFQILGVDEVKQVIEISTLLIFSWSSTELAWDPEVYGNTKTLFIDSDSVWLPVVALPKAANNPNIKFPQTIKVRSSYFEARIPAQITTTCNLDLEHFPFDSHNCSILFVELWGLGLEPHDDDAFNGALKDSFSTTTEWKFLGSGCAAIRNGGENALTHTKCWIKMERRSLYYVVLVVVPLVTMDLMTLFVFVIPPESGEKVSYIISIFLSLAIFNVYVNDSIPRSMDKIPHFVIFLGLVMFKNVLSVVTTFFVIHRYHNNEQCLNKVGRNENEKNGDEMNETPVEIIQDQHVDASTNKYNISTRVNDFLNFGQNRIMDHDVTKDKIERRHKIKTSNAKQMFCIAQNVLTKMCRIYTQTTARQFDKFFFVVFFFATAFLYWQMYP